MCPAKRYRPYFFHKDVHDEALALLQTLAFVHDAMWQRLAANLATVIDDIMWGIQYLQSDSPCYHSAY